MNRSLDFGFFSPAGVLIDAAAVDRAAQRLLALGHRVVEDEASRERAQRFAGDDETRLGAFRRMAARDDVDVAVAVRGGYGVTRLLDRLDFAALARRNRRWMGHSDFSAFQLAALAQAGMVTYAGPMAAYDFGAQEPSPYTLGHCFAMLGSHEHDVEVALDGPPGAPLEGVLWGGNLAIVAHLVGTPYLPQVTGGLVFLEDVGEHPYRVERMLYQLHYAGILARQKAVLLGAFTEYTLFAHDDGYDLDVVVAHARERFGVPVYTGLPFGHVRDKLTLPVGGRATLVPGPSSSRLILRDHG